MTAKKEKKYELLGACLGAGGDTRGPADAPDVLRKAGILPRLEALGIDIVDGGNTFSNGRARVKKYHNVARLGEVVKFTEDFYQRVRQSLSEGHTPLILGGDHSISIASISALTESYSPLGLLWIDAHADINTPETSPSGKIHGMSVAALLGYGVPELTEVGKTGSKLLPQDIAYVGLRDLDPGEKTRLKELGIAAFTLKDIDTLGLHEVMCRAFETVTSGTDGFAVSFDLDVCDPFIAPAVNTPVRGGLTFREAHLAMEMVAERSDMRSLSFVEFNPNADVQQQSVNLALSLIESGLGKTII